MLRWLTSLLLLLAPTLLNADVVALTSANFDQVLQANELVFVNFYADWCRFSQMLKPIFLEASNKFKDAAPGKIVWGMLDADKNNDIATKYHVNKYPTLKLFRHGEVTKKEYRSSRSVEALSAYIEKQMEVTLKKFIEKNALQASINPEKHAFIGYFNDESSQEYKNLMNVALFYRDDCDFMAAIGELNFPGEVPPAGQPPKLVFQPSNKAMDQSQVPFTGDFATYEYLKQWVADKCVPLVREINFQNAEELTEEGLPFMILFKRADDKTSEKVYTEAILREIPDQRKSINCLVGDGTLFKHPLSHLGKSEADLPVIAIDSFRHMYLFKNFEDINVPGKLREFVLDLHSGKLHREFHHGPDPVTGNQAPDTEPPPSTFEKLKPASSRYTILDKTEL